jgi:flagellin-like protein
MKELYGIIGTLLLIVMIIMFPFGGVPIALTVAIYFCVIKSR